MAGAVIIPHRQDGVAERPKCPKGIPLGLKGMMNHCLSWKVKFERALELRLRSGSRGGAIKNPPEDWLPADVVIAAVGSLQAFIAPFTASAVIGSERMRAPQALK